jgi:hypothetical protein
MIPVIPMSGLARLPSAATVDSRYIRQPRSKSLSDLPDPYLNLQHQLNPTLLHGAGDFFNFLPKLAQQRLGALPRSSLEMELELVAAAMSRRRSSSLPLQRSNDGLEIHLAAAQRNAFLHLPMFHPHTANPPNQWPSSVGSGGDPNAFSLMSRHLRPQTSTLPASTASTLSSASRVAESVLPFSTEEESQIPLYAGPEFFPMVLHRALAELEFTIGGRDIATFLPDGRSFRIKDQALFADKVLPVFFPKMKNFASFQRQLNLYDFKRAGGRAGLVRGAYQHKLFVRDNPAMSSDMRRTKSKGVVRSKEGKPKSPSKNEATTVKSAGSSHGQEAVQAANINNDNARLLDGKRKASKMHKHSGTREKRNIE